MTINCVRHYRLTWGGSAWGTEIWSMGLNMVSPQEEMLSAMSAHCKDNITNAATVVKNYWGQTGGCGAGVTYALKWVKFNAIKEDGKQDTNPTVQADVSPAIAPLAFAPVGGSALPQVALALSMGTGLRGKRGVRGRVYLPPANFTMVSTGSPYIDATAITSVATKFKNFLDDLNDWPGWDGNAPEVHVVSTVEPISHKVTTVRVGNVYDTQRSRRSAIKETYTELSLA
jgi:hypothetical protein